MSAPINLKLKVMSIKTLLKIDRVNLKLNLKHGGLLRFDDGVEVQYSKNEMVFLRYLLEPIVRLDLVNEYGINKVLLHLGLVAQKQISAKFAHMIWAITSSGE